MEEHTPLQHEDRVKKIYGGTKPLPDLPPELHEVIVNNLEGDKNALKQCALTCQLYRPLAQKILFETVVFRVSSDFNSADRFLDNVLKASPQIGGYVKLLSICEVNPYSSPDTGNQLVESMPLVVPAFVNLVDLVLGGALYKFQFSHLKPASQEAIINKCESLRGSLTLRHIDDVPLRIFRHLQRVETFNINNVSFVSDGHDEQVAEQRLYAGRIKRMKLGDSTMDKSGTIYQFFKKEGFGVGYLESLSMDMNQRGLQALPATDFEAARWLIRGNAASLRVLDVSISGNVPVILPGDKPLFDASKMPLLEELTLGGVVCSSAADIQTGPISLGWLSRHLETISAGQKLKRVTLRPAILGAALVADNRLDFEGLKYFEELIVDKVLPRTDSFSVDFRIWDQFDRKSAREQMQKRLPTLQALGLLHF